MLPNLIQIILNRSHLIVDTISKLLQSLHPLFTLLIHLLFKNQCHLSLVNSLLFLGNQVVFALYSLLLLLEVVEVLEERGELFL